MKLHTVLRPPFHIDKAAKDFAQAYFADSHMGYCLGSDGHLPHITIIQTEIFDPSHVKIIHNAISGLRWNREASIEFGSYYHRTDKPYNGIEIINNTALQSLHDAATKIHQDIDAPILNDYGKNFWPHMTFAKSEARLFEPVQFPHDLTGGHSGWMLEFGYTGDRGVYLGSYKPT